jgi:hypothetical protein
MKKYFFYLCFLLFNIANGYSQNIIKITNLSTNTSVFLKEKDYVQLYYPLNQQGDIFIFGSVQRITESSILLNNGADFKINKILNIDRVPIVKRSFLPAAIMGTSIGIITALANTPLPILIILTTPATFLTLTYTLKFNRKKLKRNIVGQTVSIDVIGSETEKSYFSEYSPPYDDFP